MLKTDLYTSNCSAMKRTKTNTGSSESAALPSPIHSCTNIPIEDVISQYVCSIYLPVYKLIKIIMFIL